MGLSLSRIYGSLSSLAFWGKDKEVRILMVGLDSAGKTTILYRLQVSRSRLCLSRCLGRDPVDERYADAQIGEVVSTIPSTPPNPDAPCPQLTAAIGFNVETVSYKNINFQVWDLGGQSSIRPYWRCYYANTQVRYHWTLPSGADTRQSST